MVDEEATHFRFNEESFENATRLFLVHRSFQDNAAGDPESTHSSQPATPSGSHTARDSHTPRDSAVHSVVSPAKSVVSTHARRVPKAREVESRHPSFTSPTVLRRGTTGTAQQQQQQTAEMHPDVPPQPPTSVFRRLLGGIGIAAAAPKAEPSEQPAVAERSQSTVDSECVLVCADMRILPAGGHQCDAQP